MARVENAGQIINDTALEVGLLPVSDPYSSQDQSFLQLTGLLTAAGRELVTMYDWADLQLNYSQTTEIDPSTGLVRSKYFLPDDFNRFINQTGWNREANLPVPGPLSPQTYSMLTGRDFGNSTLYVSFMLQNFQIALYPDPPPEGIEITFFYISNNWVYQGLATTDRPTSASDLIVFDPILMVKFLKVKYLSAKGMDIAVAAREFDMTFASITGYDKGAAILSASGSRGYPYLNSSNIPFTNYGDV